VTGVQTCALPICLGLLLAKLIVTGATRKEALQRAARALAEFEADGLATALPFHRAVVVDPAFAPELYGDPGPFTVHTRWIETEFRNDIAPWSADAADGAVAENGQDARQTIVVEVDGKRLEVTLPAALTAAAVAPPVGGGQPRRQHRPAKAAAASGNALTAPMQGTVIKVAVAEGQQVTAGDLVVVLEAMKMEQPIVAHKSGVVANLAASPGDTLTSGATICEILEGSA
jgi:acetyl-CoA/propionyl-CoA carboxylase biotin carboxyl carrier protein